MSWAPHGLGAGMGWVMGVLGHQKPGAFDGGTLAMLSPGKTRGDRGMADPRILISIVVAAE